MDTTGFDQVIQVMEALGFYKGLVLLTVWVVIQGFSRGNLKKIKEKDLEIQKLKNESAKIQSQLTELKTKVSRWMTDFIRLDDHS